MQVSFDTVLGNLLDLFDLIYQKLSAAASYLFMPLGELFHYVNDNVGYIDIPDWFITAIENSNFGDVSLVAFMFGGAFALTILLSFVKWCIDIIT